MRFLKVNELLTVMIFLALVACTGNNVQSSAGLTLFPEDVDQIREINKKYTEGWLENDSAKVLGLFTDFATIVPSGLSPLRGKEQIRAFWFPNDSSETKINYYDLEIIEVAGSGNFAYTFERGALSFSYEKGDFTMERESESYAFTIYEKQKSDQWKIVKRMWTDLKK